MTKHKAAGSNKRGLDRFELGGDLGPVQDRNDLGERLQSLPAGEKGLGEESARFADLCQFFEQQGMDVPAEIVDQLGRTAQLPLPERIQGMKELNARLMDYLSRATENGAVQ